MAKDNIFTDKKKFVGYESEATRPVVLVFRQRGCIWDKIKSEVVRIPRNNSFKFGADQV